MVITLELDLNQVIVSPMVFAKIAKLGLPVVARDAAGQEYYMRALWPGWESLPLRMGGYVRDSGGRPIAGAAVRLMRAMPDGSPVQFGPTVSTGADGRYILENVPEGRYTFVVEVSGQSPVQQLANGFGARTRRASGRLYTRGGGANEIALRCPARNVNRVSGACRVAFG